MMAISLNEYGILINNTYILIYASYTNIKKDPLKCTSCAYYSINHLMDPH